MDGGGGGVREEEAQGSFSLPPPPPARRVVYFSLAETKKAISPLILWSAYGCRLGQPDADCKREGREVERGGPLGMDTEKQDRGGGSVDSQWERKSSGHLFGTSVCKHQKIL